MNNVSLTIGGREFVVGCTPGQEDHIRLLGEAIESKVVAAKARGLSEARMLLFAALLLADENDELKRAGKLPPTPPAPAPDASRDTQRLLRIAETMEKLAQLLECPLEGEANDL
ncbi:cell division protein ZapA [Novosphingobium profundi]|uniref:cell division protein ZapA n=1 Tax=Novosphingobium profundi TaxID=1774954 RepID=UPI001BDA7890|nr:cell division protein ZapA [Novosphingobium profundi]MBT0669580.1 cell division protein ZapA [Novosphingobium profundi]